MILHLNLEHIISKYMIAPQIRERRIFNDNPRSHIISNYISLNESSCILFSEYSSRIIINNNIIFNLA